MFNRQMRIVQAGKSVLRVIPRTAEENCPLLDVLEPVRPHIQLSFQTILAHISTIYVLKTKPGTMLEPEMFMRLKVNGLASLEVKSELKAVLKHFLAGPNDVHR